MTFYKELRIKEIIVEAPPSVRTWYRKQKHHPMGKKKIQPAPDTNAPPPSPHKLYPVTNSDRDLHLPQNPKSAFTPSRVCMISCPGFACLIVVILAPHFMTISVRLRYCTNLGNGAIDTIWPKLLDRAAAAVPIGGPCFRLFWSLDVSKGDGPPPHSPTRLCTRWLVHRRCMGGL